MHKNRNSLDNSIIEGERIGNYSLSDTVEEILIKAFSEYEIEDLTSYWVYVFDNIKIWVLKEDQSVYQISAFNGKFLKNICIGTKLGEVERIAGEYFEEFDVYFLRDYPGICFELEETDEEDIDELDERETPIGFINIYNP